MHRWDAVGGQVGGGREGGGAVQTTEITRSLAFAECLGLSSPFSSTLLQLSKEYYLHFSNEETRGLLSLIYLSKVMELKTGA